jgi:hypothetical protein
MKTYHIKDNVDFSIYLGGIGVCVSGGLDSLHDIYEKYNLMDTLYPVTRSCEWVSYTNWPDPGNNHCGKCWWCQERVWGFGKL